MSDLEDGAEREYHVEFTIDDVWATSPREAAQIVASMLCPDGEGYAHAAVYGVSALGLEGAPEVTIDLSDLEP